MEGTKQEDWVVILEIYPSWLHCAVPDGSLKDHYVTACGMHVSVNKPSRFIVYGRYSDLSLGPDQRFCERCYYEIEDILDGGRVKRIMDEFEKSRDEKP